MGGEVMNRRDLSGVGATAVAGAAMASSRLAFAAGKDTKGKAKAKESKYEDVIESASECIETGEQCLAHCLRELAKGNKDMAECAYSVSEMLATCKAIVTLASLESEFAKEVGIACMKACKKCKEACEKHKEHFAHNMHLECKACADACKDCEEACRKAFA
jgi:Cys-rich four helix bundle protein (predicted Tat secretion target)